MNEGSLNSAAAGRLIFLSWLVAVIASAGSLFFSEVMKLTPCVLCWYQRIFMFPLAIILLLGLHPLDLKIICYALPLALIGFLFTLYHSLLFYGFIPEDLQPCSEGVPCSGTGMELFGVLPIPLLSLAAFALITLLLWRARALSK